METYKEVVRKQSIINRLVASKWLITTALIIFAILTWVLTQIAANNPQIVEKYYSSTVYPYIGMSLGSINSLVPFSIAEIALILLLMGTLTVVILCIIRPKIFLNNINNIFHTSIRLLAIIYILFYFLWGFNYFRVDYMNLANMHGETGTVDDLIALTEEIIQNLNHTRINLKEDNNGVFYLDEDFLELSKLAQHGFKNYTVGSINLDGNYGQAKPVLLSEYMGYTGIMGIYIPFTAEPNVNKDIPPQSILSTITHEMAHQRGFAKEEEANFIAYKANINNPDIRFKYSGYYLATQYLLNEIYIEDKETYFFLYSKLSDAVIRDMDYSREYWKSKEGKTEEIVTNMNDTYLKANNQTEGVRSYNGVVKLLLAEYKSNKDS